MKAPARILFVGLDSADPDLLLQWGREGLLPSIHSFCQRSLRCKTILPTGLGTGAMWVSLYTGVSPATHGRYFGRQIHDKPYKVAAFDPNEVMQDTVWSAASRAGKLVAVIDIPIAPLSRTLNGIQIKDWGCHDPVSPRVSTYPLTLAAEVTSRFGSDPVGPCDRPRKSAEEYKAFRDLLVERVGKKAELASHYLDAGKWDLFMVGFGDAHCVGHQCWHLHDPGHPIHDPSFAKSYGDPVKYVYVALDMAIGRLLERVSPGTTIILFAGSGMGPNYTGNHLLDEALRRLEGVKPPPSRKAVEVTKQIYRKLIPDMVRSSLGSLGDRVDESSLVVDRARRSFYAIPHNDLSGAIRFNVVGREPRGRIRRGVEYDALCEALRRELMALVNPDTGESVVNEVLKTSDVYGGPYLDQLPDLLVVWNRERPITAIGSEKIGEVRGVRMSKRTGDHNHKGAFLVHGPDIQPGEFTEPVAVESLAATIAALLDVPLHDVDGIPVPAICR